MARDESWPRVSLSVIMAGFNEESNLQISVRAIREALEACTDEFEIILINDGSRDQTGAIADAMAKEDECIRVHHNPVNVNYGISLQRGIALASCDWILHEPFDLPLAPSDIQLFVPHFRDADVVVARRLDRTANSNWRRLTSWTNNLLLRLLFQPRTTDLNFVQFYRRTWAQSIPLRTTSPATVTPELILTAEHTGKEVREVEVEFRRRERGHAHFGKLKDILWTLRDLLSLRVYTWLHGWPEGGERFGE